eukprot:971700-Alexandrium_andersonii.AAC.1
MSAGRAVVGLVHSGVAGVRSHSSCIWQSCSQHFHVRRRRWRGVCLPSWWRAGAGAVTAATPSGTTAGRASAWCRWSCAAVLHRCLAGCKCCAPKVA